MVSSPTICCVGEALGSAERIVADEHLLTNWSSLGGNRSTTLSEQQQGHFPSWSPLGGNEFLRHEESLGPSRGNPSGGNHHQTNFLPKQQGWQTTASPGYLGGSPSNVSLNAAKQEKVEDSNFSRFQGIGRLENSATFGRDEKFASVMPDMVGSPSFENHGVRVGAASLNFPDSEKMKNLRQHLLILLHAHKCQRKLETRSVDECKVPFCANMRGLLEHMKSCRVAGQWQCPVPHCTSSCKILAHWKSCKKLSCQVCAPLKQPNILRTESMSPSTSPQHNDGRLGARPHLHQGTSALQQQIPRQPSFQVHKNSGKKIQDQIWQNSISSELRAHLVEKMVLVLKTSSNQSQMQESDQNLLMVAKKVEVETHQEARSSEEYFQLMSEKTATMSIGGALGQKDSSIIGQPVSEVGSTGGGETRSTTEAAVKNILRITESPSFERGPKVEKGNANLRPLARQSLARKEPRGMSRSPSANHSSNGGISKEVAKAKEVPGSFESKSKATLNPTDLRTALLPPLEKLYSQEPESEPFRSPVDPVALGIEGYFDVVKKPMDLSRIRRKLEVGSYQDPWQFIGDVYLMLENAWLYNKKNSRVYKFTSKVGQ